MSGHLIIEVKQQWATSSTWMGGHLSPRPGMGCLTQNLILSPDIHKYWGTTYYVSDGFAARACRPKLFLALIFLIITRNPHMVMETDCDFI